MVGMGVGGKGRGEEARLPPEERKKFTLVFNICVKIPPRGSLAKTIAELTSITHFGNNLETSFHTPKCKQPGVAEPPNQLTDSLYLPGRFPPRRIQSVRVSQVGVQQRFLRRENWKTCDGWAPVFSLKIAPQEKSRWMPH